MKSYDIQKDCLLIRRMLKMTQTEFADAIELSFATINRIENGKHRPTNPVIEKIYSYAYENNLRINSVLSEILQESFDCIYFHGAKNDIEGEVDLNHSDKNIDFGPGFYLGESYKQASSFVSNDKNGSVYVFKLDEKKLNIVSLEVDLDWMLAICYYRDTLKEAHRNSCYVQRLIKRIEEADVIIAPIADNSMYEIMTKFAQGKLTNIQASHCLSASYLGKQHVIKSSKALTNLKFVNRLYLCKQEKIDILKGKVEEDKIANTKVDACLIKYRREGKYIEEILDEIN